MGSQVPAFAAAARAGLLDFWSVYEKLSIELGDTTCAQIYGLADAVVRHDLASQLSQQFDETLSFLRNAIVDNDWAPFIDHTRALGSRFAELGFALSTWQAVSRRFHARVVPALIEAYRDDRNARLTAVLVATGELVDFWILILAEAYLEAREEQAHQLEAINREVEAFSYSVAHDLRAPLRSVSGFTQILLEDFAPRLDHDAVNYLTKIQGGVARMTALIDALLGLAKLVRSELEIKLVNLSTLARAIADQLTASEPARAVHIVIDGNLRAMADGRLVRTLLENLLGNAWKFTSKCRDARIEVGSSNNRTFFVKDNGAGFDMARAHKLFAPFERLHAGDDYPGSGVGLATVQRIIDRHGGRIWAQSAPGQGATFFFTLSPLE